MAEARRGGRVGLRQTSLAVLGASFALRVASPAVPASLALASAGCAGSDCASDAATWGSCSEGERIDVNTWESGPLTGKPWLDFHGERTWVLDPTPWMGAREPVGFQAYLSLDPTPVTDGGSGFAEPAGNLAILTPVQQSDGSWKVKVLNDTCAQYYLRVVLTYAAPSGDGGTGTTTGTCG